MSAYREAHYHICLPIIPVQWFILFGVCFGILASSHASVATAAQDYLCCILFVMIPGLLYDLWVMKRVEALAAEIMARKKQTADIRALQKN